MHYTEIISQVNQHYSYIIDQINNKNTIDNDIIEISKQIDLLLEQIIADKEKE
ncbi:MAG: hypothetical protein N4A63_04210 [Vallitalea sp.]|jgi:hypothetical protein|nr:hypothetical protein [Vallitalea sp.]